MVTPFLIGIEVGVQVIGEEKQFKNGKHDEQLYQDDDPQPFAYRAEVAKAVVIEEKYPCKDVFLH